MLTRTNAYQLPYIATAPCRSRCPETKRPIHKGDTVAFFPAEKLSYHRRSSMFRDVASVYAVDLEGVRS